MSIELLITTAGTLLAVASLAYAAYTNRATARLLAEMETRMHARHDHHAAQLAGARVVAVGARLAVPAETN